MSIFIVIITTLLFAIGAVGTLIPGLPGIGLVYAGILLFAFADGFTHISSSTTIYLGIVTLIASITDYVGSVWATSYAGGKKKALIGTIIGALVGSTGGPFGIFLGAFLGALAGALLEGNTADNATRVALVSVLGIIGGSFIQFLLSLVLIGAFLFAIYS